MPSSFAIRAALPSDVPVLRRLIDASVRRLQSQDYTPQQIDSALRTVFGVDSQLIGDGTYLLVETVPPASDAKQTVIVACGGWSKRKTLFGGDRWHDRVVAGIVARLPELPRRAVLLAEDETHLNLLPHVRPAGRCAAPARWSRPRAKTGRSPCSARWN